jgi:hypothetical protein
MAACGPAGIRGPDKIDRTDRTRAGVVRCGRLCNRKGVFVGKVNFVPRGKGHPRRARPARPRRPALCGLPRLRWRPVVEGCRHAPRGAGLGLRDVQPVPGRSVAACGGGAGAGRPGQGAHAVRPVFYRRERRPPHAAGDPWRSTGRARQILTEKRKVEKRWPIGRPRPRMSAPPERPLNTGGGLPLDLRGSPTPRPQKGRRSHVPPCGYLPHRKTRRGAPAAFLPPPAPTRAGQARHRSADWQFDTRPRPSACSPPGRREWGFRSLPIGRLTRPMRADPRARARAETGMVTHAGFDPRR